MLNIQNRYIDYLSKVKDEVLQTNLSSEVYEKLKLEKTIELIKEIELIVPVIGAFSAGKSSLLNSFLGDKKLLEKITPETALATELRYSKREYIEAVKSDDIIETFAIDELSNIKERASEFKYLKMYLNNDNLQKIEPLVLVDMPGFESPLNLHNQAIMEYINKGVHYIILSSVEDGNITKSMTRQIENILEYKRDFSFFLSKTNLKPKNEIEEIKEHVQEQLEEYFDKEDEIGLVDDNGGESLKKVLFQIDPKKLFENLFLENLKDGFYDIKASLNTNISALNKSTEENQEAILKLQKALRDTQRKRDQLIEEAKNKYSDTNINRIVEAVGRDLSDNIDEIVSAGINGGETALSNVISEITKSSLISNVKGSMTEISNNIIEDFSHGLTEINSTMSDFTLSKNWLDGITNTTKKLFESASSGLDKLIKDREGQADNNDKLYKIITTILSVTTTVVTPIVELIIIFLPELLSVFFASFQERKQREQIQHAIITTVVPSLKRKLRTKLPDIFNTQIDEMIINIAKQFEGAIEEKKVLIENTQKEIDEKSIDIEKAILDYENASANITLLANKTLY
ncbi:MAG TPA: hypothetical protein ENK66_06895 [Arcobacter sp.]|nr:hypothetical protein [Arcobacter sp.]